MHEVQRWIGFLERMLGATMFADPGPSSRADTSCCTSLPPSASLTPLTRTAAAFRCPDVVLLAQEPYRNTICWQSARSTVGLCPRVAASMMVGAAPLASVVHAIPTAGHQRARCWEEASPLPHSGQERKGDSIVCQGPLMTWGAVVSTPCCSSGSIRWRSHAQGQTRPWIPPMHGPHQLIPGMPAAGVAQVHITSWSPHLWHTLTLKSLGCLVLLDTVPLMPPDRSFTVWMAAL